MPDKTRQNISLIINELTELLDRLDSESVRQFLELLLESPAVFMAGAGRSGLLIRCAAMRFMHLGLRVHVTGDVLTPPLAPGNLLVIASGSGETASLVAMAQRAEKMRAPVALVTANAHSTLAGIAQSVVLLDAPTPKADVIPGVVSAQPMGSLFEQAMFLFFEAVTMVLMQRTGATSEAMFKKHANLE